MEWKLDRLRSLLKPNKEKMILLFCAGLLLFVLALPTERKEQTVDYETSLERRIEQILRDVEGIGDVQVMVALSQEQEQAMFQEEQGQEVSGILISADGGGSAIVKAEISEAMEALFGLPSHKIKVLKRVIKESEE